MIALEIIRIRLGCILVHVRIFPFLAIDLSFIPLAMPAISREQSANCWLFALPLCVCAVIGKHIDRTHSIQFFTDGAPLDFGFCMSFLLFPFPPSVRFFVFTTIHQTVFTVSDQDCQNRTFKIHQGSSCVPVPGILSFMKLD
jgi:hypothetical protein